MQADRDTSPPPPCAAKQRRNLQHIHASKLPVNQNAASAQSTDLLQLNGRSAYLFSEDSHCLRRQ